MMSIIFLLIVSSLSHAEVIGIQCQGRSYLHRITVNESAEGRSYFYEKRRFWGEALEEKVAVERLYSNDAAKFAFRNQELKFGLVMTAEGRMQRRSGRMVEMGRGSVYKSVGFSDPIQWCWVDHEYMPDLL